MRDIVFVLRVAIASLSIFIALACTPQSYEPTVVYKDLWLCFTVEVPKDWYVDGVPGGFADFGPPGSQATGPQFIISAGGGPTLEASLNELRRGSLGQFTKDIKDVVVDGLPALYATLDTPAEYGDFKFAVMVIAPDCGDGQHGLFISGITITDQKPMEEFLSRIRFIYEIIEPSERVPCGSPPPGC